MKKIFLALLCAVAVCGCASAEKQLIGTWVEPIPSMPGHTQGFNLAKEGKASSVNMATLVYEKWQVQDGKLILEGKSLGNGQTIPFTETWEIDALEENTLSLSGQRGTRQYARQL